MMDWALAIERNRQSLLQIVVALCTMIGFDAAGGVARVTRKVYRAVLTVLRPAEAAVRRLIVVAARGIVVTPRAPRPVPAGHIIPTGTRQGRVSFQLFDPCRSPPKAPGRSDAGTRGNPRIRVIDVAFDPRIPLFRLIHRPQPEAVVPEDDHTVNAGPLGRRLAAIRAALEDLPRQAKRYARWQARPLEARRPKRVLALRAGPPPGLRARQTREVDEILSECHWLARHAAAADTS
jgi:hypothetical protein